jgi:thiosulfate/3-mercaptopyruvate sulfurtransferase
MANESFRPLVGEHRVARPAPAAPKPPSSGPSTSPALKRDAAAEYLAGRIPGAVRFDIDAIADHSIPAPHAVDAGRSRARWARWASPIATPSWSMTASGSAARPGYGGRSAPSGPERVHSRRRPAEVESGRPPVANRRGQREPRKFAARLDLLSDVQMALAEKVAQVVDARPANRFRGQAPEPRPGVRSGHMPGTPSVPSRTWSRTADWLLRRRSNGCSPPAAST